MIAVLTSAVLAFVAAREMPAFLDLGTHQLRAKVRGQGSPTVVFETFGPAPLEIWNGVEPKISKSCRTFSYDHAGYWGSPSGPRPRDARRIATELHAALAKAKVPPPYLLVGYSFGGPYTRVFASLFPDEVVGLILVDPTQERFIQWLHRALPAVNVVSASDQAREDEWGCQNVSMQQAEASRLQNVPLTLISASPPASHPYRALVTRLQAEHALWLTQYPQARHVIADNTDHGLVVSHPEIVVSEIRRMLDEVQKRQSLPARP
ncbi:MAG: alpha/beta hydrolase [Verrucomicrobiales bacterium]|nr:alpha/beta hydrolase [Verrucomicrobiales bacterium]